MNARAIPPPLVKVTRHPIKWTAQKIELLIDAGLGAHIGTLIIVGLYYLLFEVYHPFTVAWHTVVSDNYWRHLTRDVGEGLLGGTLGQMLVWNAYRKVKPIKWFDRLEMKLHIPNRKDTGRLSPWQLLATPLVIILYAVPGFVIGGLAASWIHGATETTHHAAVFVQSHLHSAHAHTYWQKVQTIWTHSWDKKLIGLFASLFLGRRPVSKVADEVQLWFAERRADLGKPLRFYHPPVFKARYNQIREDGLDYFDNEQRKGFAGVIMLGGVFVGLALAGFGWYVLTYIAAK